MAEQYETLTTLTPTNPNRETIVVHLCRTCGALVVDMGRHDAHHARLRTGVQIGHGNTQNNVF